MSLSTAMLKKGGEWHPGCMDHELSNVRAKAALRKYSQQCDMLHLQTDNKNR